MKLLQIQLHNWQQHRDVDISFTSSTVGLIGNNGKGKSNFLCSIGALVTGDFAAKKEDKKEDLISWGETEGWGRLKFEISEGKVAEVYRELHSSKATLHITGEKVINGAEKVTDRIMDLLGVEKPILKNIVFIKQDEIDHLLFAGATEKERMAAKFFGLESAQQIEKALSTAISSVPYDPFGNEYEVIRQKHEEASAALVSQKNIYIKDESSEALQSKIDTIQADLRKNADMRVRIDAHKELSNSAKSIGAQILQTKSIYESGSSIESLESQIELLRSDYQNKSSLLSRIQGHKAVSAKVSQLQSSAKGLQDVLTSAKESLEKDRKSISTIPIDKINELITHHRNQKVRNQQIDSCEKAIDQVLTDNKELGPEPVTQQQIDQISEQIQSNVTQLGIQTYQCSQKSSLVDSLSSEPICCPTCDSVINESNKSHLYQAIKNHGDEINRLQKSLSELRAEQDKLSNSRSEWCKQSRRIQFLLDSQRATLAGLGQKQAADPEKYEKMKAGYDSMISALNVSENQFQWQQKELDGINARLSEETAKLSLYVDVFDTSGQYVDEPVVVSPDVQIQQLNESKKNQQLLLNKLNELTAVHQENRRQIDALSDVIDQTTGVYVLIKDSKDSDDEIKFLQERKAKQADLEKSIADVAVVIREMLVTLEKAKKASEENRIQDAYKEAVTLLRDAFHPNGAPKILVTRKNQQMEERVQSYLSMLTSDFTVQAKDGLSFDCIFPTGTGSQGILSGGQKINLSWSFRLAACETFSSSVGLMCMDEPTVWLDAKTKMAFHDVVERLKLLSDQFGMQFLVSTHDENLIPYFGQVIKF